jgi:micrococcal nuclease
MKHRSVPLRVALAILSLVSLILLSYACTSGKAAGIQVIDGDTIATEDGHYVRYIGINAPEKGEPYYEEATEYNRQLLETGSVRLEGDEKGPDTDRYGRLLRYVYAGSTFVNAELVRAGYAYVYPEDLFPQVEHYDLLKQAEEEARQAGRGIWRG